MLTLTDKQPFARGGNRLCYVHPENSKLCVKVRRPDFTLEDRRRKKGFPKNLRPLSAFDDNLEEYREMQFLEQHFGDRAFQHISRCYGFVDTDMGKGLVSELIRNPDGRIAVTLKQYLWDHGLTDQVRQVIEAFIDFWTFELIPSRDLLLHNIVVEMDSDAPRRLVVIDGLGATGLLPFQWHPRFFRARRVNSKIKNFRERIDEFLTHQGAEKFPGPHGLLLHDGSGSDPDFKGNP